MGKRRPLVLLGLLAAGLPVAGLPGAAAASPALPAGANGLHDYVFGRFAVSADELGAAAGYFAQALSAVPEDPLLRRRAFDLALLAGDERLALELADRLDSTDRFDSSVALLRVTAALKARNWKAVDAARQQLAAAGYSSFVIPVVEAWTLFGRGKKREAVALLDPERFEGFARAYVTEHRAHILAASRDYGEAATIYRALLAGIEGSPRLRLLAATTLQADDRDAEALAVLETGRADEVMRRAAERIRSGDPAYRLIRTPQEGVAALFGRMGVDLARERAGPISVILARLGTFLAPERADSWLTLADLLARGGQNESALAALDRATDDPLFSGRVLGLRAGLLEDEGEREKSLALLREAAAQPGATVEDWLRLGEMQRRANDLKAAVGSYDEAIARVPEPKAEHWHLYFLRGSALEQSGQWPRAEADLRRAAALAPREATVLNYLGYSLLDRGLNLPEAERLIRQAVALRPDDGHIVDSLGWAHFMAGRYPDAVVALERAIGDVPGDPTINEHLGDAYWRVGRKLEARFRWRAALDSEPTEEQRTRVAAKVDFGLDRWQAHVPAHGSGPPAKAATVAR